MAEDIEVVGNASEKDLRRTLAEVETFRSTLRDLYPGLAVSSHQKTLLIALRDPGSFQQFAPRDGRGRRLRNVAGYFDVRPYANLMVLPMFGTRETTYQVAFHEYTHYLIYRNLRNVPGWLNEGLAEFYSTFSVESDGRRIIGKAPAGRLLTLRLLPMFPLARFLDPASVGRMADSPTGVQVFYAQAWGFVHFLMLSDKGSRQGQLLKYFEALQTAPTQADAARQAFGADMGRLSTDLSRYLERDQFPAIVVPPRPSSGPATPPAVEPLTEADAHYVQGRLLVDLRAVADAEAAIGRALAVNPTHVGARVALGRLRMLQEREAEGIQQLASAAEDAKEDFEAQYFLGEALRQTGRYEESIKQYDRTVALNRQSPDAWFGLSLATMSMGRQSQSQAAMRQVQFRYADPYWYASRAEYALGLGQNEVAARDAREYLNAAGWADEAAPYAAFIGAIAHWRLQQTAEAEALLADAARAVPPKSWVATVVQYLQGGLTEDAFLDRARDDGQRTEAHTYAGLRVLIAGNKEAARKHFLWVKERGDRNYSEYALAFAELKRLESADAAR